MIGRRRFLGASALGWLSASFPSGPLFAQDPRPKSKAKSKAKAKDEPKAVAPAPGASIVPDEQVNRILAQARTDGRRLPGFLGAIVRGDEVTNIGAVGIRKIGSDEPIRFDDAIHLGSCTKAMTATMIGTVVDEGKLRWDSTIREALPEIGETAHPDYQQVTLAQLLTHRAGLAHDVEWWKGGRRLSVADQRQALMAEELRNAPIARPGTSYDYSNIGYVLAGMMAERATGTAWEDLMTRRVFRPLGMASAGFGPPGSGSKTKVDHAWGHKATRELVEAVYEDNPPAMGPAGTVHCSLIDWAKFATLHMKGAYKGTKLVKPETLKTLHTPPAGQEYAGGWAVVDRSWAGGEALNHSGSNTFWYCTIWIAPEKETAFLVATNAGGKPAEEACDQAITGLVRYALPTGNGPGRRR